MGNFTHASVFSGIGGSEVAVSWMGWDNLFHCEINPFCRKVLEYWFPQSESYEDITKTNFTKWRGRVDVLTGGFPCQPFSYAGQRRGEDDDRYLWPEMLRVIGEVRPSWVVGENVAGITTMVEQGEVSEMGGQVSIFEEVDDLRRYQLRETFTLQRICDDLESHGYSVQPVLIPACAVGAPHKRDRVFIIGRRNAAANTTVDGCDRYKSKVVRRGCDWDEQIGSASESDEEGHRLRFGYRTSGSRRAAANTANLLVDGREPRDGSDDGRAEESELGGDNRTRTEGRAAANTAKQQAKRAEFEKRKKGAKKQRQLGGSRGEDGDGWTTTHTTGSGRREILRKIQRELTDGKELVSDGGERHAVAGLGRWDTFPTVSPVYRGDDGLPFDVARLSIPFGKWRNEAIKACGNAIVPQVMYEIFRAIEIAEHETKQNKIAKL